MESKVYLEGYHHYSVGLVTDCPYDDGSEEQTAWVQGFWDAAQNKTPRY